MSIPALPDMDDPLLLPDGTILHANGSVSRPRRTLTESIEIPSNTEAQKIITNTRRTLADLPLEPASTNPVAIVLSYVLFGLSNTDMSIATGLTEQQITNIRASEAFTTLYDTVKTSIIEKESENIRGFFTATSRAAATRVAELVADTDNPLVALKASQDILDRAGHRPVDVVQINNRMENILKIEHYRKDGSRSDPSVIDLKVVS